MKIAIIGCGAVVEQFYVPALKKIKMKPVLFSDPIIEHARRFAGKFKAKAVSNYCDSIDDFDCAIVAVPHQLHVKICCELLEQGKHVLVEKPLALNSNECQKIISSAKLGKVTLSIGNFRRYRENGIWLKGLLDSGELGEIEKFTFYEGGKYNWPVSTDSCWKKESAGGGVLFDTGAHTIDQLCWWLGKLELQQYEDDELGGVEADCRIRFKLSNGATGLVELSRTRSLGATAIIVGSKVTVEIGLVDSYLSTNPSSILSNNYNEIKGTKIPVQSYVDLMISQINNWMDGIINKSSNYVTGEDVMPSISIIEECYNNRQHWHLPWVEAI